MDARFENSVYPSHFDDSMFEPNASYEFEESHEQEMRNMHQNIAALNAFLPVNSAYRASSSRCGDFQSDFFPSGINGSFPIETEEFSGVTAPSSAEVTHTSKARPDNVGHQYGHIVPLDEEVLQASGSKPSRSPRSDNSSTRTKLDKSERARHAANQRHARPKRERGDSQQDGADAEHSEDGVGDKREKYREKNRVAAAKCRAKKKENTESLEGRARAFQARNTSLKRAERELRNELVNWQHAVLAHNVSNTDCTCGPLHEFNRRRASQLATGWMPTTSSTSTSSISQDSNSSIIGSPESINASMVPSTPIMPTADLQQTSVGQPPFQFNRPSGNGSMCVGTYSGVVDDQQFPAFLQRGADGRRNFA